MVENLSNSYRCFDGHTCIAAGSLATVALAVKRTIESGVTSPILIFDDATGRSIDLDLRGSDDAVLARLGSPPALVIGEEEVSESRGRGRPKLGVVAREVTLLPRHWEWLATQPGGASVTLRKLVEEARRTNATKDRNRITQERAYRFMSAVAGDMVNFEDATRALFANDQSRFSELIAPWPDDVQTYATMLAFGEDN